VKTSSTNAPVAQTSTFSVILPLLSNNSGAMYLGDPPSLSRRLMCVFSIDCVRPKSQSLAFRAKSITTLRLFRSRWTNGGDLLCKNVTPSTH